MSTALHAPADGEVVGIDTDGCLLLWDSEAGCPINCGETLAEFGTETLTPEERAVVSQATGNAA
ncbi:hypothetical protein [Variovorax paradoxus]|uniref:hypothetical protein n=1 Tax=Variovorax paradoxus TaxID=34073 RepID=UPI003D646EDF